MTKDDFAEMLIFHLFKDKVYGDTKRLKTVFKEILGCEYEDNRVNDCYVKITNYQIAKYGHSLYCSDAKILRRR